MPSHDTMSVQRQRGLVPHLDAEPYQATVQDPFLMDPEANGEARLYYQDSRDPNVSVHFDPRAASIRKQLGAKNKPKVAALVENMYDFRTSQASSSISHNAAIAQDLLRDLKFIYPVRLHSKKHPGRTLTSSHQKEPRNGRDPYRHPIIQRAINTIWFRNKDDIGVVDHEHFSPMPISILAITLTMV